VSAAASIWGAIEDRRDIRTGHPSWETLLSYTGIWSRDKIIQILGEPDKMDRFVLPDGKIHELPVFWGTRLFDNTVADVMCIIFSIAAPIFWPQYRTVAISVLTAAAGLQTMGYAIATIVTYRSGIWRKWSLEEQQ